MIRPDRKHFNLEYALAIATETPKDDLATRIEGQPNPGTLPEPSSSWLCINLMLYRDRQRWACKELQEHFPRFFTGQGEPLEQLFATRMPGMPAWYVVIADADWGAIHNDTTMEKIVINRYPEVIEHICFPEELTGPGPSANPWDIAGRLAVRARGREIHAAIDELMAAGILLKTDSDGVVFEEICPPFVNRLAQCARHMRRSVRKFRRLWEDPKNRLWLAALIGDWPSANEIAQAHDDPEVRRVVANKFDAYRQRRLAIARCNLSLEPDSLHDLEVLCREEAEDFQGHAEHAIQALGCDLGLADILIETGDLQWNPYLFETLQGTSGDTGSPARMCVVFRLAEALLQRGYRADDVLAELLGFDDELDRVAMVFLKHAPLRALPLIRQALRSECATPRSEEDTELYGPQASPRCRRRMAAALAIIDDAWSRQEILDALNELWAQYQDYSAIGPLVLAMGESRDLATREIGESWRAKVSDEQHLENEEFTFGCDMHDIFQEAIALRDVSVEPGK